MVMMTLAIVGVREIDLMTAKLAALDALGDLDFPFAREERDGAHLAQVHADGIVGLVERARRQSSSSSSALPPCDRAASLRVGLLGVDDLDAALPNVLKRSSNSSDEVISAAELIDLVVEEIPLLLADGDELLDLVVFFFSVDRQ